MSTMLYKQGLGTKVWGKEYKTIVVKDEDISEHLKDGWYKHPDEVPDTKAETKKNTRTRTNKAESDEHNNEG